MDLVTDLQVSPDRSYFVTSSKDKTARVSRSALRELERICGVAYSSVVYSYMIPGR